MKNKRKVNIRVEIEPAYIGDTEEYALKQCGYIVEEVKRHVDNIGYVTTAFESEQYCSFCNATWEEDEQECPVCCEKAQDEWMAENNMKYDESTDKFVGIVTSTKQG